MIGSVGAEMERPFVVFAMNQKAGCESPTKTREAITRSNNAVLIVQKQA